jgi:rhodanese-related sulfurtransferase
VDTSPAASIPVITAAELSACLLDEDVLIVNVLPREWYEQARIARSISIPLDELPGRAADLNRSKNLVVYCASRECMDSSKAARFLTALGFDVAVFAGGMKEWRELGLPWEGTDRGCGDRPST